ncbi:hypothetical protein Tco_0713534 [Tanacetum coccineum]
MKSMGSLANNDSAWITLADGRPLKSILKKPKLPSDVPGKDGRVRIDVADGNHAIGTVVGSGSCSKAAVPNPSEWFEAAVEPDGVKGCNDKESIGGVNMVKSQTETKQKTQRVNFRSLVNEERVVNYDIASQAAKGKSDSLKSNLNPFDALNTLSEDDISGRQQLISCKGVKDPNVGSTRVKKNLVFYPQPKIHYFTRDDTDDANMDVGAECGAFSSIDTHNEDLESDEEVDEHIFSEGDQFDIWLKGRSRQ